ncbi:Lipoprotein OS=Streptomyces tendae OX=1932 GN=GUR47_17040 PE=4 SV=1 [Streptomyces tendae]
MSSTAVRRTALAASAAALALLVTACGGSSYDDGAAGDDKAKAERSAPAEGAGASAPAGKALTAAELEKVVLAQADVKPARSPPNCRRTTGWPPGISADDKSCLPLVHAQGAVAQGKPAADVQRSWQGQSESPSQSKGPDGQDMTDVDVNKIMLNVASYADGGAEQAWRV